MLVVEGGDRDTVPKSVERGSFWGSFGKKWGNTSTGTGK